MFDGGFDVGYINVAVAGGVSGFEWSPGDAAVVAHEDELFEDFCFAAGEEDEVVAALDGVVAGGDESGPVVGVVVEGVGDLLEVFFHAILHLMVVSDLVRMLVVVFWWYRVGLVCI